MKKFFQDRVDRLRDVTKNTGLVKQYPLLSVMRINPELYAQLVRDVQDYIAASLRQFNPGRNFEAGDAMLQSYESEIINLPNRTPNGKLAAKVEVAAEFNRVQVSMEKIIEDFKLSAHFESMQLPVLVRIQQGLMDAAVDNRSYATTKLHSDIWTGEPASSGTLIVPIMGDLENIGLEFNEPELDSFEDFVKTYSDYKDTEAFLGKLHEYDCGMEKGNLYFFDSFCVHRTIKKKKGLRVSIDFRAIFKEKLESDEKEDVVRIRPYCSTSDWFTSHRNVFLMPRGTVEQTIEMVRSGNFPKGYDLRDEFREVQPAGGSK